MNNYFDQSSFVDLSVISTDNLLVWFGVNTVLDTADKRYHLWAHNWMLSRVVVAQESRRTAWSGCFSSARKGWEYYYCIAAVCNDPREFRFVLERCQCTKTHRTKSDTMPKKEKIKETCTLPLYEKIIKYVHYNHNNNKGRGRRRV